MTGQQAHTIFVTLRAAYPSSRKAVTEETMRLYEFLLLDYEYGRASSVIRRLITESQFFPSFAEIARLMPATRRDVELDVCPECEVAAGKGHASDCSRAVQT